MQESVCLVYAWCDWLWCAGRLAHHFSLLAGMLFVRATARNRLTDRVFSTTFALCVVFVGMNLLVPCPVDRKRFNDEKEEKE